MLIYFLPNILEYVNHNIYIVIHLLTYMNFKLFIYHVWFNHVAL